MPICERDKSLPSVPRSKGCLTCVTRKKRCDGRRPICRACEDRKQVCGGYRRQEIVFLSEGWRAPGVASNPAHSKKKSNKKKKMQNKSEDTTTQFPLLNSACSAPEYPLKAIPDLILYTNPAVDRSHPHIAFFLDSFGGSSLAFQAPTFIVHIFRHYFSIASSHVIDTPTFSFSPSAPVVFAVNALAQGHFGMANADTVSVRRSFHSYGMALHSMSVRLAELERVHSDFHGISEEDWQHLAVFCLVMMFWELKMSPASRNWQNHIRGLISAISLRDTDHAYSKTNFQLLSFSCVFIVLQTLSARKPSFLLDNDLQQRSPISSAWLIKMRSVLAKSEDLNSKTDFKPYTPTDSLIIEVTPIASIMDQYDQLRTKLTDPRGRRDDENHNRILMQLYNTAETILYRNEERLTLWNLNVRQISLSSWPSLHQDVAADPISGHFWSLINGGDLQPYFETVLSFRTMMEYHAITLYWTIVISLRLLLSDILTLMVKTDAKEMPVNPRQTIGEHRIQLRKYALNVLQTICYATLKESRTVAPFFFATAFQLTVAILERECKSLQASGDNEDGIRRCKSLKSLAVGYLDWAIQNKIPVKMDLHSPGEWELESIIWDESKGV